MDSIILKYYDGTAWQSLTFYYTKIIQAPNINKSSGETLSGVLYQNNFSKRYNYNVNLLLSDVSPYTTTLSAQKSFLYNFFPTNKQRMTLTYDSTTYTDTDIICETNGIAQLDLIENSKYIRTVNLVLNEKQNKSGSF